MSLLQMSLSGTFIIIAVVLIRYLAMHKLPKKTFLALWIVALIRLLIPFSVPSQVSIFNVWVLLSEGRAVETLVTEPTSHSYEMVDIPLFLPGQSLQLGNTPFETTLTQNSDTSIRVINNNFSILDVSLITLVYLVGVISLAVFFCTLYIRYRRGFMASLPLNNDFIKSWLSEHKLKRSIKVRVSDTIVTPLTYGVLKPVILLPKTTNWEDENKLRYILTHEFVHIKRFDAITKLMATVVLCVHWFNPFVWVMYFLLNRDIEISCDEDVIKMLGDNSKADYALTLIGMVDLRSNLPTMYNNFSEYAIEERINAIMKMKKGTLKGTLAAVAIVGTTATVFATTSVSVEAHQNTQGNTTVASQEKTQSNFEVVHLKDWNGFPFDEPSLNDISAQEAGEIAANAIEQLFDVSLEGATIYMSFEDNSIESQDSWATEGIELIHTQMPNMWNGTIMPNGADMSSGMFEYRFSVNSETGEFISVSFMPDAAATIGVESGFTKNYDYEYPNKQHNYELSHYAMQLVEERNILDSEIARARISSASNWFRGWEQVQAFSVWVQCVNGESVELMFSGSLEDEKELVMVRFLGLEEPDLQDMYEFDSQGNVINNGPHNWVNR